MSMQVVQAFQTSHRHCISGPVGLCADHLFIDNISALFWAVRDECKLLHPAVLPIDIVVCLYLLQKYHIAVIASFHASSQHARGNSMSP